MEEEKSALKLIANASFAEDVKTKQEIKLRIDDKDYLLKLDPRAGQEQDISLKLYFIPSLLGAFIFFLFFFITGRTYIPLTGSLSTASLVLVIGVISGFLTSTMQFIYHKRRGRQNLKHIYWRNFPTIIIALTLMVAVALLFIFYLLGLIFNHLSLDIYLSVLIAFIFFSIINYFMLHFIFVLSPSLITKLLVTVIIGGVLISMVTNSEAQWWKNNLSFLGTSEASGSWQFNLTLIISAFLMIALVDYLFVNIQSVYPQHKGLWVLRILLIVMSISLALVGYFPADGPGSQPEWHNQSAAMLVYTVIIMIVGIKWFIPNITREFQMTSYSIGLALFILTILFERGSYISLTAFEIIAFLLAFSWLLLLLQALERSGRLPDGIYELDVIETEN